MTKYRAVYEVFAGTVVDGETELDGLTPAEMAERVDNTAAPYVGVCHQCADSVNDPQVGDLVAFTVDGVEYSQIEGQWQAEKR